jgi:hypothetical protein
MVNAIQPRSEKVLDLMQRGLLVEPNEIVTHDELSEVAGCNVRKEGQWALRSMLRILEREEGIIFEAVRGVGLRRIVNGEQIVLAEKGFQKTDRAVVRIRKKIETTRVEALSRPQKNEYQLALVTAQILHQFANPRRYLGIKKAIVSQVFKTSTEACNAAYEKTLAAFQQGRLRQPKKA